MASIELISPGNTALIHLRDHHTFGRRNHSADTSINSPHVSKLHASIEWHEPNWLLKDMSKNGIRLNNKAIQAHKPRALNVNDTIDFAGKGEAILKVVDLNAPASMLVEETSPHNTIAIEANMLLPDEVNPEVALRFCPDRLQWFTERRDDDVEFGPHKHGDLIKLGASEWKFVLQKREDSSLKNKHTKATFDDIVFRFDIGQDEQFTNLTIIENSLEIDLGERPYYRLLMLLLEPKQRSKNAGWFAKQSILNKLGIEQADLNLQLFNLRKQVAIAVPHISGHAKLIERRHGALRTNITNYKISQDGSA